MKVPSEITVAGITYQIIFNEDVTMSDSGNEQVARIDFKTSTIEIHEGLGEQITDTCFLHELQHAVFFAMGYIGDMEVILDESFIERSAHLWYQVMEQIIDAQKSNVVRWKKPERV